MINPRTVMKHWRMGASYEIQSFQEKCPLAYQRKLLAMGFMPGVEFKTLRQAPLGDPIHIEIKGTHVSLRRSELEMLEVIEV